MCISIYEIVYLLINESWFQRCESETRNSGCEKLNKLSPEFSLVMFLTCYCFRSQSPSIDFLSERHAKFHALINYEDPYVQPLILNALESHLPPISYTLISSMFSLPMPTSPVLQITSYETIDFPHLLNHPSTSVSNAYVIRKALIRKHYLAHTISAWSSKTPTCSLKDHVKLTLDFELDYAEFLDEALIEAYELQESFVRNEALPPAEREWWILKPGMSDRGQGIRLFSTESELKTIFEGWEETELVSDNEPLELAMTEEDTHASTLGTSTDAVITSQLRHFVVQQYINPPLLFPSYQNRKFHVRSYVLAIGALRVYIYNDLLALFAPLPYTDPSKPGPFNPQVHLTNTCLQTQPSQTVHLFSSLPSTAPNLAQDWKSSAFNQIATATGELFLAAARTQSTHFQPLPNAFEVFGVDWLLDATGNAWLLEVNAFPDFAQSGEEGKEVVRGLWEGVLGFVVAEFFNKRGNGKAGVGQKGEKWGMKEVLNVDLGRR